MIQEENENLSDLDKLHVECCNELGEDKECKNFQFDFAFALLAFCNDWHSGMSSDLYALSSALTLEWEFNCNMDYYDESNCQQRMIYEWLETKQEIGEL